ncbi:MAG: hypothetical protein LQ347_006536, partial [Umbilicaria vellea]
LLDGPAVDIYVGNKRKHFAVQKKLVCSRSTYFDKAFNGAFKEGHEGAIYLPDDSPDTVEAFIAWLYRGTLQQGPLDSNTQAEKAVIHYVQLYLFAEKYGIESLQNQSTDGLLDALSTSTVFFNAPGAQCAYDQSPAHSPFRRLVARCVAYEIARHDSPVDDNLIDEYCSLEGDFMVDLITLFRNVNHSGVTNPLAQSKCDFHVHSDGARCDGS